MAFCYDGERDSDVYMGAEDFLLSVLRLLLLELSFLRSTTIFEPFFVGFLKPDLNVANL